MLREIQVAMMVHRVGTAVEAMPARHALRMATVGGARVLGRDDIGVLAPGMAADVAAFDLSGIAYAGALHDPVSALLFCGMDSRAELVLVNGEVVVRGKRLVRVEEGRVAEDANRASEQLLRSAGVIR
jgi:cytosine/adenosine deaminase-related metal-dependent hydrolase